MKAFYLFTLVMLISKIEYFFKQLMIRIKQNNCFKKNYLRYMGIFTIHIRGVKSFFVWCRARNHLCFKHIDLFHFLFLCPRLKIFIPICPLFSSVVRQNFIWIKVLKESFYAQNFDENIVRDFNWNLDFADFKRLIPYLHRILFKCWLTIWIGQLTIRCFKAL